jgi:FkbM family methyltransferase
MTETLIERGLCAAGLYRPLRLARNRYLRPDLWERTVQWRKFYSQFIAPGDLVFDIGANHGDRTETFVGMGARVVAVEPIPSLAARLERIFRYSNVRVEGVGVGRSPGELTLHVCSIKELSSFSAEFIESQRSRYPDMRWEDAQKVPVVTLESLVDKHGLPSFIKIDVEGFENEVLAGLEHAVKAMVFEIRPHDVPNTLKCCMNRILELGPYEFNISLGESQKFELPSWGGHGNVLDSLANISQLDWAYADVYARSLT